MCLLAFAWRADERYDFVFAGNRDEFHERPTAPAAWWPARDGAPAMLAGRDLAAGGTWLGLRRDGAFATVTNVRAPSARRRGARSRGNLVTDLLLADGGEEPSAVDGARLQRLARDGHDFAHFNLLTGSLREPAALAYVNNPDGRVVALDAGLHTLSNDRLNTAWPKCERVGAGLRHLLAQTDTSQTLIAGLLELFADRTPADDGLLPDTGLTREQERALFSPFIADRQYGTRATTIILCSRDGEVSFVEQSYAAGGTPGDRVEVSFRLTCAPGR